MLLGGGRCGALAAVVLVAAAALVFAPSTAQAQCVLVGSTVTCTNNEPNGFSAGAANNLTVNVQPLATVQDNAGTVNPIDLNDGNIVTNRGTVSAGDGLVGINAINANTITNLGAINFGNNALGIAVFDNNIITNSGSMTGLDGSTGIFTNRNSVITNAAGATLTLGNSSTGIYTTGGSTVSNFGAIVLGNGGGFTGGIIAIDDGNTILNATGASITGQVSSIGMSIQGLDNRATNNGAIAGGDGSLGMFSQGDRASLANTGTILGGDGSYGIITQGDKVSILNSGTIINGVAGIGIYHGGDNASILTAGTIVSGDFGAGIVANGSSMQIVNTGSVTAGSFNTVGIVTLGDNNTIVNAGTINVGDGGATGIWSQGLAPGSGNVIINTGTINVGTDGTGIGILVDNDAAIYNAGTINAGLGLYAIQFCNCSTQSSLTLATTSVINGIVMGTGTQVLNLGGASGTGVFDLSQIGTGRQYDGFATFNKVDTSHWILTGVGTQDWQVFGGLLTLNGILTGQVSVSNSAFAVGGTLNGGVTVASGTLAVNGGTIDGGVLLNTSTFTTSGIVNGTVTANNSAINQTAGLINGAVILNTSTFTSAGTVTGPVTVTNGALTSSGVINGAVLANNSAFTTSGTVNGGITMNGGSLTQTAGLITGAVLLNNTTSSVRGTISNAVTVNGGTLSANGTIGGAVIVDGGGILSGNGTLGPTTINNGTLSPGNSIGTLTVQGNLVLSSAASYIVEIGTTTADRTNATGTATIAGTVQASFANPLLPRYTIISANGGVLGTFGTFTTTNLPAAFAARLTYDTNNVYVSLTSSLGAGQGLNQNQQNVATSLNTYFNGGGALTERFGALFSLTGQSLRNALSQVSGEIATQSAQAAFSSVDYFLNLMLDPFVTGRSGDMAGGQGANNYATEESEADAYAAKRKRSPAEQDAYAAMARKAPPRAAFDQRWSVWGAGYGGELKANGDGAVGARDASTRAYGFAAGADYRFSPDTLAGFALSGGGTSFSLAQGAGSGRSDVFQAGAFVRHNIGQAYLKGAVAYGWHDVTTDRTLVVAGIDKLEGRYNANSFAARGEAGYRFVTPWMGVTPYAAAQSITYFQPGYADNVALGLNTFALNYASRDITSARSELGLRADRSFLLETALLTLRGRAGWAHYFDSSRSLTASFQTLAAPAFVVTGAAQARDAALVSASADVKWMNGFSLAGVFEGEFSGQTRGYAGKGILRYQW